MNKCYFSQLCFQKILFFQVNNKHCFNLLFSCLDFIYAYSYAVDGEKNKTSLFLNKCLQIIFITYFSFLINPFKTLL